MLSGNGGIDMMDINTWLEMTNGNIEPKEVIKAEYKHQEQPNEEYYECLNDYLDGNMNV